MIVKSVNSVIEGTHVRMQVCEMRRTESAQ